MKTEDLIGALVADNAAPAKALGSTMAVAVVGGAVASCLLFLGLVGLRPDFVAASGTSRFVLKFVECAALAIAAGLTAQATLRPVVDRRLARIGRIGLAAAVAVVAIGVIVETVLVPAAEWRMRLVGSNWFHCLTLVPFLAAPAFVVLMAAAPQGASTMPGRTGAVIGITAGAIGAFFYAANCTDDSPLFVATWYTIAIAATGLLGALIGRRALAW